MNNFCHLHVHTKYSLLDGLCKTEELIAQAKALGQPAIAITDHGNMFGVIEFYKCAKNAGIKPIIGCEVYMATGHRTEKNPNEKYNHLILLAKNNEGYHNLMKLVSLGYTEGYYYKPRIDFELLKQYKDGLVCLTACLFGAFSDALVNGNEQEAEKVLINLKEIFGEDLFVELQDHDMAEQKRIINKQISLAEKHGVGLVATNDVHYIKKEDSFHQEILMCIQMQKTIADEDRMKFSTDEFYLKSAEEMNEIFGFVPEALQNTYKIAEMCNVEIEFGKYHLPKFKLPPQVEAKEYLKMLCINGMKERYPENYRDYMGRLNEELDTINAMGFTDYFLIVWDFINYARTNGIPVGPGRGSAAGSIVAYALKITNLDPIKYNLIFERFLNSERVTMPDIDIDFCYERRSEVIDYVIKKYGIDKVSQIITFGTLGAKQAVRDVARALAVPYGDADKIAKLIPRGINITLKNALEDSADLKKLYEEDENVRKIIDISLAVEGLPRHASTHAAGVVVTNKPIMEYVPLYKSDDVVSTQYTMTTIEELGLLKMDFLGLRNLTVINDTVKIVKENSGAEISMDNIDYGDHNVYSLFRKGETDGVFQFESPGMRRFLREFKPETLEDLILAVSVYRPGPMQEIPKLVANKEKPEAITYEHEMLKDILSVTYGCMVYQEQVMEIFKQLAGYTLGKADIVRRAMSKKKIDVLNREEEIFVAGCAKNNIEEKTARSIFTKIKEFAKYAFNKSHAACYAYVAYQTAYLKYYYKAEFMAALMTSFNDNQNKVTEYIKTCDGLGIKVLPPSVNESNVNFTSINSDIIFGLNAVKNVGFNAASEIVEERKRRGEFSDFEDFTVRMLERELNKRTVESLIKAGAFDMFGDRLDLLKTFEITIDYYSNRIKTNVPGQLNLFDEIPAVKEKSLPYITKNSNNVNTTAIRLKLEKEVMGVYLSSHPLKEYETHIKRIADTLSFEILNATENESRINDGSSITLVGIIQNKNIRTTRKGQQMATFQLEDLYGSVNVVAFPKAFMEYSSFITEDNIVVLKGNVIINEEEPPKVIMTQVSLFNTNIIPQKLYIKVEDNKYIEEIKKILREHSGNTPVYVYFSKEKKNTIAEKSMWVTLSKTLISRLKALLGDENVVLR